MIHLYDYAGKTAYTESVLNILISSLQIEAPVQGNQHEGARYDDYHTRYPQTVFNTQKKKSYSSVVSGNNPVEIQNRFSPLNC